MYDGATALAEAALMSCNITRRSKVAAAANLDPQWLDILEVYLGSQNIELIRVPYGSDTGQIALDAFDLKTGSELACMIVGQPNFLAPLRMWNKLPAGSKVLADFW